MPRAIQSAMQTELAAASMRPVYLAYIGFAAGGVRLCSLPYDLSWSSLTWLGNGWMGKPRAINETSTIRAVNFELELVGVNSALMALALDPVDQTEQFEVYLGALNSSNAIVADPIVLFKGKMDTVEILNSLEEPTILVRGESSLARLNRQTNFRYTDGNQQAFFAGDTGFRYMPSVESFRGFWGKAGRPKWLRRRRRAK